MQALRPEISRLTRSQARQEHLVNLNSFGNELQEAFNNSLPSGGNFDRVEVLAFHFENDTMGVEALEAELLELFESVYHYTVSSFKIPSSHSSAHLGQKLTNWSMERALERTLRIYVFSGHGAPAGTTDLAWWIGGDIDANGRMHPEVNIKALLYPCENLDGECLYIFDCCSAGSIAMSEGPEALTACGWEQSSSAIVNWSFTRALIDTLRDIGGRPATVSQIFTRLYRYCHQNQVGACPLHVPKMGRPSITLKPLQSALTRPMRSARGQDRVLLCINLSGSPSVPNIDQWQQWLTTNIPTDVLGVEVRVEAAFSGSCQLLITVPVEVWTMLPFRSSYQFVAHVTSNNIFSTGTRLPHRPAAPSGRENQPLSQGLGKQLR